MNRDIFFNIHDALSDCKTAASCIREFDLLLCVPMHALKILFACAIALVALQSGCSRQQKELTSADEQLVPVYAELLALSEELRSPRPTLDSAAYQSRVQSILSKNGLTKEELSNRLTSLAQTQELFSQFQTKVHTELERLKSTQHKQ